jgi:hypothetical protein
MAIRSIKDLSKLPIQIDLTGPDGNAFVLMSYARAFCKAQKRDHNPIIEEMMKGDYDHLVEVFDREFGEFVTLYR